MRKRSSAAPASRAGRAEESFELARSLSGSPFSDLIPATELLLATARERTHLVVVIVAVIGHDYQDAN
jgi:hypothetical protein